MNESETIDFVERYGRIYEHSPWVAECAAAALDVDASREAVRRVMVDCVDNASRDLQLQLIRAHPDLADRAALAGGLTKASGDEQASAGLDQCTPAEFDRFQTLNSEYKRKFGFPFIMAVRGATRGDILTCFAARLRNSLDEEFETALVEIHRIAELRLQALAE